MSEDFLGFIWRSQPDKKVRARGSHPIRGSSLMDVDTFWHYPRTMAVFAIVHMEEEGVYDRETGRALALRVEKWTSRKLGSFRTGLVIKGTEAARQHVKSCSACKEWRRQLSRLDIYREAINRAQGEALRYLQYGALQSFALRLEELEASR